MAMTGPLRPVANVGAAAWLVVRSAKGLAIDLIEGDPLARRRLAQAFAAFIWAPLPVLCVLAGLVGVIVGMSGAQLLKTYDADLLVAPLIARVLARDIGPVLVGVFAAGRVSVALATHLSEMRLKREFEALDILGLDPVRYALTPALTAVAVAAPLHAFCAAALGLVGAGVALRLDGTLPWARFLVLAATEETARNALVGAVKVLSYSLLAAGVGAVVGSATRPGEASHSAPSAASAFTLGLLSVIVAATLWAVLS